jgi:hypothetical protein
MQSSSSSTTIVKRLPDYAMISVQAYVTQADKLSNNLWTTLYWNIPGSYPTYAPQDPYEIAGIAAIANRGNTPNPVISDAITFIENMLEGQYLSGSDAPFQGALIKFQDALATTVSSEVLPVIGPSLFFIADLTDVNLSQTLESTATTRWSSREQAKLFFDNYLKIRTDQHQTLTVGIEHARQSYKDADVLRLAGYYQREYDQGYYKDLFDKYVDAETYKYTAMEILGNSIRAMVGTQSSKTEPFYKPSPVSGLIGGAMTGASLGAMTGNPVGIGAGAVVGGIMGMLTSH